MLRRALLLLLLAPCVARAQQRQATPGTVGVTDRLIDREECLDLLDNNNYVFTWLPETPTPPVNAAVYRVKVGSSCPADPGNADTDFLSGTTNPDIPLSQTTYPGGKQPVSLRELIQLARPDTPASCDAGDVDISFCVYYFNGSGSVITGQDGIAATGLVEVQVASPPPPRITRVDPRDSAFEVSWDLGTAPAGDVNNAPAFFFRAEATPVGGGSTTPSDEVGQDVRSVRISGLTNGVTYNVVVFALSQGQNQSDASAPVTAAPIEILDFWERYKGQGGREEGGCASGSAGAIALLAVALLARSLVRRRA